MTRKAVQFIAGVVLLVAVFGGIILAVDWMEGLVLR